LTGRACAASVRALAVDDWPAQPASARIAAAQTATRAYRPPVDGTTKN
jgi:hypothetical protein